MDERQKRHQRVGDAEHEVDRRAKQDRAYTFIHLEPCQEEPPARIELGITFERHHRHISIAGQRTAKHRTNEPEKSQKTAIC